MGNSVENIFIDALTELLTDISVELYDGSTLTINSIHYARKPAVVGNDVNVVIVPKGPKFEIGQLGGGATIKATDKIIAIELYVFVDGIDEQTVLRDLSNITFTISETIMKNRRLGNADFVYLFDADYDWATAEDSDNPGNVLAATSAAKLPIVAVYRRGV